MKYKKGALFPLTAGGSGLIIAVIIAIFVLLFLGSGGAKTIFNIGQFISKIPSAVWIVLGIIVLFRVVGGKKR